MTISVNGFDCCAWLANVLSPWQLPVTVVGLRQLIGQLPAAGVAPVGSSTGSPFALFNILLASEKLENCLAYTAGLLFEPSLDDDTITLPFKSINPTTFDCWAFPGLLILI